MGLICVYTFVCVIEITPQASRTYCSFYDFTTFVCRARRKRAAAPGGETGGQALARKRMDGPEKASLLTVPACHLIISQFHAVYMYAVLYRHGRVVPCYAIVREESPDG